jgi:hypothetical protein
MRAEAAPSARARRASARLVTAGVNASPGLRGRPTGSGQIRPWPSPPLARRARAPAPIPRSEMRGPSRAVSSGATRPVKASACISSTSPEDENATAIMKASVFAIRQMMAREGERDQRPRRRRVSAGIAGARISTSQSASRSPMPASAPARFARASTARTKGRRELGGAGERDQTDTGERHCDPSQMEQIGEPHQAPITARRRHIRNRWPGETALNSLARSKNGRPDCSPAWSTWRAPRR